MVVAPLAFGREAAGFSFSAPGTPTAATFVVLGELEIVALAVQPG
jgi:hypothetical protein